MQLFLDDEQVKLPELEGVVLLNINSWSSGCTMWNDTDPEDNFGPASMDDELLEVVGLYSSLHVGRIQVSMADPIRLGQAKHVKVCLGIAVGLPITKDSGTSCFVLGANVKRM